MKYTISPIKNFELNSELILTPETVFDNSDTFWIPNITDEEIKTIRLIRSLDSMYTTKMYLLFANDKLHNNNLYFSQIIYDFNKDLYNDLSTTELFDLIIKTNELFESLFEFRINDHAIRLHNYVQLKKSCLYFDKTRRIASQDIYSICDRNITSDVEWDRIGRNIMRGKVYVLTKKVLGVKRRYWTSDRSVLDNNKFDEIEEYKII